MNISFSIVTVTFQNLKGLTDTFSSVKSQDYEYFDWIIIDGLSTDGTVEYIKSQENQIKNLKWVSEKDAGIYDGMNKGIKKITGDYVIFLNAGDRFFDANVLKQTAFNIQSNLKSSTYKAAPIFYGNYVMSFAGGTSLFRKAKSPSYISHSLPTSHQAIFYPREFLASNSYNLAYKLCNDYYLTCVASVSGHDLVPISNTISMFEMGGRSSQHFLKAIKETYNIQRSTLKMNAVRSQISAVHRLMSYLAAKLLNRLSLLVK